MRGLIIEPHYLPNLRYFSKFLIYETIIIDDLGFYRKQSFRNRANILGANGILTLIIPVIRGRSKITMKEAKIDNRPDWRRIHWNSILSAYNKASYFEYYRHLFEPFYLNIYPNILGFNLEIINVIKNILELNNTILLLSEVKNIPPETIDLRNSIDPKSRYDRENKEIQNVSYNQVFSDRFAFMPGLSCIDLIFNMGPLSSEILRKGIIQPF